MIFLQSSGSGAIKRKWGNKAGPARRYIWNKREEKVDHFDRPFLVQFHLFFVIGLCILTSGTPI